VKNVNPGRGIVTERVTEGRADGCTYILSESQVLRPRV
jgi:hypothetical protein